MYRELTWLLRGSVRVRAHSPFPERVLNLCSARGIPFRDPVFLDTENLRFTVTRRDWRRLREAAAGMEAELLVEGTLGAPFLLGRLRGRYALLAGLCLCAGAMLLNACFIWDFQVEGNGDVPPEKILRVLADCGVDRGTFVRSIDQRQLCNRALLQLPELCWLTVNVRGCRATVTVRPRVMKPEIVNEALPTNVVASRDALVTEVRALDGQAMVLPGTTVQKGRLLISGVVETQGVETPTVHSRFLAGKGEVWGRTWYELSTLTPLRETLRRPAGKPIRRYALLWGEKRLKIFGKETSNLWVNYDKIISRTKWSLPGGLALPVTWVTETLLPLETVETAQTREAAETAGRETLEAYLRELLGPEGEILSRRYAAAVRGDRLLVTLSAECREQIGETVPIPMGR